MLRMYHLTFLIPCGKSLSHGSGICCRFKGGQNDLCFHSEYFSLPVTLALSDDASSLPRADTRPLYLLDGSFLSEIGDIHCWPLLNLPSSVENTLQLSSAFWRSAQNDLYKRTSPDVPFNEHLSISHRPCYRTVIDDSWSLDKRLSEWLQIVRLFFEA